jgi:hypothetical protein
LCLLFESGPSLNLMLRMSFLRVSYVRMFICIHHLGILFLRVWFVSFVTLFMALSRLLGLDFSAFSL